MAARKTKGTKDIPWPEATRNRIKTSMLINRLSEHILGNCDMSSTQVQAAKILLDRTLPVLQSQEIVSEVTSYVARLPEVAKTAEAWIDSLPEGHRSPLAGWRVQ